MTKLSLESVVLTMLVKTKRVVFAFRKLNYNRFIKVMTNTSEPAYDFSQLLPPVHRWTRVTSVFRSRKVIDRMVDNSNCTSSSYHLALCRVKVDAFDRKKTGQEEKLFI